MKKAITFFLGIIIMFMPLLHLIVTHYRDNPEAPAHLQSLYSAHAQEFHDAKRLISEILSDYVCEIWIDSEENYPNPGKSYVQITNYENLHFFSTYHFGSDEIYSKLYKATANLFSELGVKCIWTDGTDLHICFESSEDSESFISSSAIHKRRYHTHEKFISYVLRDGWLIEVWGE